MFCHLHFFSLFACFSFLFLVPSYRKSWLATKSFVESEFGGCTVLEDVATVTGFSEGGYASVVGALALRDLGVEIKSLRAGGVPFRPETQFAETFQTIASGTGTEQFNQVVPGFVPLSAYAFSNDSPLQANAGTDQTMASPDFLSGDIATDLRLWFNTPQPLGIGFVGLLPARARAAPGSVSPDRAAFGLAGAERGLAAGISALGTGIA